MPSVIFPWGVGPLLRKSLGVRVLFGNVFLLGSISGEGGAFNRV